MSEQDADFVTILSSELIATVMEQYFNKSLYKQQVKVVDLKPTETGYMFSLAFAPPVSKTDHPLIQSIQQKLYEQYNKREDTIAHSLLQESEPVSYENSRDAKGRFTSNKKESSV